MAIALVVVSIFAPNRTVRGLALLLLCAVGIGGLIAWQSRAGRRLSESGRDMDDYWPNDAGMPPSA